jgi:hypothetical protein
MTPMALFLFLFVGLRVCRKRFVRS